MNNKMAQNSQSTLPRGDINLRASEVEACRICLETNTKLHEVQDTHLEFYMKAIGGFANPCGGLPNYICYECAAIVMKCYKIIHKSKMAEATLLDIFEKNGQITETLIEGQNRSRLNLTSSLECHLLLNYYHIQCGKDDDTSDFINFITESKKKCTKQIEDEGMKVETNEENTVMEELDDSVEEIKVDIPLIEISGDETSEDLISFGDETIEDLISLGDEISEDFISLAPYKVEIEKKKKKEGLRGISQRFQPKPLSNKQKKKAEKRKWRQINASIVNSEDSTNSDEFPPELKDIQENINIVLKTVYFLCSDRPCPHWWQQQELIKTIKNCSRCPPTATPSPLLGGFAPKEERS